MPSDEQPKLQQIEADATGANSYRTESRAQPLAERVLWGSGVELLNDNSTSTARNVLADLPFSFLRRADDQLRTVAGYAGLGVLVAVEGGPPLTHGGGAEGEGDGRGAGGLLLADVVAHVERVGLRDVEDRPRREQRPPDGPVVPRQAGL